LTKLHTVFKIKEITKNEINKILQSILGSATLAFTFSACSQNAAVNNTTAVNTANQSNTAVVVNSNQAAVNNTNQAAVNNAPSAPNTSTVYTPEKNSPERKAIADALRVPVSKELKQEVIFEIDKLKVQGDWAFISGQPKAAGGGEPNWKITKYQAFIDNGDFEEGLYGLLKKTDGKWSVVKYMMNCHDVCYLGWDKEYKAPKAIFD
jgi:hypothetical protein